MLHDLLIRALFTHVPPLSNCVSVKAQLLLVNIFFLSYSVISWGQELHVFPATPVSVITDGKLIAVARPLRITGAWCSIIFAKDPLHDP